ncbi:SigE family RNA polymerase sigma factor [Actinacidiphila yanglinensis]|uniref:SigE family RNA polymerase sigma factor n=1 Tax=Actinacidiphila yanglinensis TaxID=310779 RepID=UPI00389930D0
MGLPARSAQRPGPAAPPPSAARAGEGRRPRDPAAPAATERTGAGWDFDSYAAARWPTLVHTAYLLTGDRHEAEDVVQATLAKVYLAWNRISRLDEPDAYVHRALVNNNLSRFRKRRVVQLLTSVIPDRPREPPQDQVEERALLVSALATLPPRQRAAVVLRYWEDLSEHQVAEILGCSTGNVKSQASRGLRKLREHPALAALAHGEG